MIRSAVWWVTTNDCLHTQRQATKNSPDRIKKLALISAWKNLPDQNKGITAAEAVKMARERIIPKEKDSALVYPELASALLELGHKGDLIDSQKLGYFIRGMQNATYDGSKFVQTGKDGTNKVKWSVEPA